jgi:hypothetical protein
MAEPTTMAVVATAVFHHPGGVLLPGQAADLPIDDAKRGISLGVAVPAQTEPVEVPKAAVDSTKSKIEE